MHPPGVRPDNLLRPLRSQRDNAGMALRFPAPLRPGDRIGVTSPSSGVGDRFRPRLDVALRFLREHGFDVEVGACMDGTAHVSAPARARAAELMRMLADPAIRAIIPPWGGETAIDLLPYLDWAAIAAAEPTWYIGYSDNSTLMLPLTLRTGIATLHGSNLMDTPLLTEAGLASWLDLAALEAGGSVVQTSPGLYWPEPFVDYRQQPEIRRPDYTGGRRWSRLDADGPVDVSGRLIGGCIETICHLAGTGYGDVGAFAARHERDGLIIFVEAAEDNAFAVCRSLHGMRLAGFFDAAAAVLIGATLAPAAATMTQHEAVVDALGSLGIPLIADVECGHVYPRMTLLTGAMGRVEFGPGVARLTQTFR